MDQLDTYRHDRNHTRGHYINKRERERRERKEREREMGSADSVARIDSAPGPAYQNFSLTTEALAALNNYTTSLHTEVFP